MTGTNFIQSKALMLEVEPNTQMAQIGNPKKVYRCGDCTYWTTKKSSFVDHHNEFCIRKPIKTIKCPVCPKIFTYRALRIHLNYYVKAKHAPRDEYHSNVSQKDHEKHKQNLKDFKM